MVFDRRFFLAGGSAFCASLAAGDAFARGGDLRIFRPEEFGAVGDGRANDTAAFAALSAALNRAGGGEVVLRPVTYLVGRQSVNPDMSAHWAYPPMPILHFENLPGALRIRGNGARLRCAPGLRYGTFDRRTGRATRHEMPSEPHGEVALPYQAMIYVANSRGPIEVRDIELDGNLMELEIGGQYGDVGWQIPAMGIFLVNNLDSELIVDVHTHHHAQDGVQIDGIETRRGRSRLERVLSEYNGRQGCSLSGVHGYDFVECRFNHQGRSAIRSSPGAGMDIEAEGGERNRDITFANCEFNNNSGVGMVADSGDSADVRVDGCTFVGTTNWSVWPKKPGFRFAHCTFVGALANAYGSEDPDRAAQFRACQFFDDPALAGNMTVYVGSGEWGPIADLGTRHNILFDVCQFDLRNAAVLPWSKKAIYRNCNMRQQSDRTAFPRGIYLGRTIIDAPVDLYGSEIRGEVVVNGKIRNESAS